MFAIKVFPYYKLGEFINLKAPPLSAAFAMKAV